MMHWSKPCRAISVRFAGGFISKPYPPQWHCGTTGLPGPHCPTPLKDIKTLEDASASMKYAMFRRDAWHCRFCATQVIDPRVRKRLSDTFVDFRWRWGDLNKHACLAMLASHDHVVPRQWVGSNEPDNVVTACWPYQFSKHNHRIEVCGIIDPRDLPRIDAGWDELCRVLDAA